MNNLKKILSFILSFAFIFVFTSADDDEYNIFDDQSNTNVYVDFYEMRKEKRDQMLFNKQKRESRASMNEIIMTRRVEDDSWSDIKGMVRNAQLMANSKVTAEAMNKPSAGAKEVISQRAANGYKDIKRFSKFTEEVRAAQVKVNSLQAETSAAMIEANSQEQRLSKGYNKLEVIKELATMAKDKMISEGAEMVQINNKYAAVNSAINEQEKTVNYLSNETNRISQNISSTMQQIIDLGGKPLLPGSGSSVSGGTMQANNSIINEINTSFMNEINNLKIIYYRAEGDEDDDDDTDSDDDDEDNDNQEQIDALNQDLANLAPVLNNMEASKSVAEKIEEEFKEKQESIKEDKKKNEAKNLEKDDKAVGDSKKQTEDDVKRQESDKNESKNIADKKNDAKEKAKQELLKAQQAHENNQKNNQNSKPVNQNKPVNEPKATLPKGRKKEEKDEDKDTQNKDKKNIIKESLLRLIPGYGIVKDISDLAKNMSKDDKAKNKKTNREYIIKDGDTFGKIAQKNGLTLEQLQTLNPLITDINNIGKGDKINLGEKADKNNKEKKNEKDKENANSKKEVKDKNIKENPENDPIKQQKFIRPNNLADIDNIRIKNNKMVIYDVNNPGAENRGFPKNGKTYVKDENGKDVLVKYPGVTFKLDDTDGIKNWSAIKGDAKWGTSGTINSLIDIGKQWNEKHPNNPILVGHISAIGGKSAHSWTNEKGQSIPVHQRGNQVDIKIMTKDGNTDYGEKYKNNPNYDQKLTKELIQMIADYRGESKSKNIFFNDETVISSINKDNVSKLTGHDDHIHITYE